MLQRNVIPSSSRGFEILRTTNPVTWHHMPLYLNSFVCFTEVPLFYNIIVEHVNAFSPFVLQVFFIMIAVG